MRTTTSSRWSWRLPTGTTSLPLGRELCDQSGRGPRCRSRHDNRVERCPFRQAERAVAHAHLDAGIARREQGGPRLCGQLRDALDPDDLRAQLRQDGSLVAGAGADVQHALVAGQPQLLAHPGDHRRLGDRGAVPDRECAVLVGPRPQLLRHEELARDAADRRQHALVRDPASPQPAHKPFARGHARARGRAYAGAGTPKCASAAGMTSVIVSRSVSSPIVSIGTSESPASSDPCEPPPA